MTHNNELSRRKFLTRMWAAGGGLMAAAGAWTGWDLLRPSAASSLSAQVKTLPPQAVPATGVVEVKAARAYLTREGDQVVAISWRCPHLGCRVPWCESSQQFECPCHGSLFNRIGEYREGPSPRNMDRLATSVVDGSLVIDPSNVTQGDPPGPETINEPPAGPKCVGEGG